MMEFAELRDNLRTNLVESRQLNRDKVLRNKRIALQDVVDLGRDITVVEVVLVGNKLKSKSSVQVEDLTLLKLSFVQDINSIIQFLKVKGALHSLVRELSSNKSNFQLVAAECCCNLALGDAKSCLQVAKAAGPYLMALLGCCNYNLISVSVWALGNLVGSDEKTWKVIHAQGFLGKLLTLMEEHDISNDIATKAEIQQNSLSAIVQLLRVGCSILTQDEIELIAKTVASLKNSSGKGFWVSMFLLSCMDSAQQHLLASRVHVTGLQFLEKTELSEATIAAVTAALRTIANLVAEPSGSCALDVFANWRLLGGIVQKVFVSPYRHLVNEVGWLLGNFLNHSSPDVQLSVEEHSLDFRLFESQVVFFSS